MSSQAYTQSDNKPAESWVSRSSDLVLAFVVVAIIGVMIMPLPLAVLDTLVAANIAIGVMLVLMSIYVTSALQFSAFPSVLLISTLFRLALSVATTRMILLNGDAGHIIDTFGQLVAGGNLVVGLVVFLIITLVQFLVIAKGAERVAEVGARFTLDAMPGKQMSIDSDLRSGLLDKKEARAKRSELELESKLHGSLDGAMKFVKGDAIAGIIIIIINLLGGLSIGVFQLDMSAGDAMAKYSILTIGDGMVAQIPALMGAMAAGLIVTRVTDGTSDKHLGDSIQKQFSSIPRVLIVAGVMCLVFAFVPGFPSTVFVGLGLLLVVIGGTLVPGMRLKFREMSQPTFDTVLQRKTKPQSAVHETQSVVEYRSLPLILEMPIACAAQRQDSVIRERMEIVLQQQYETSGVELPKVHFQWHKKEQRSWSLNVHEVPVVEGLVAEPSDMDVIAEECHKALRRNVKLFIGMQEVSVLLMRVSEESPDIVKEVLRAIPMQGVATIMRNLIEEEVPIRNMRAVLEALVQASQHEKDLNSLTEYARMALARQLCHRYAVDGVLTAVGLSPALEEKLLQALRTGSGGPQLSIEQNLIHKLQVRLIDAVLSHSPSIIVAPVPLRKHMRTLVVDSCFDTPVLSYPELVKPSILQMVEQIDLEDTQQLREA